MTSSTTTKTKSLSGWMMAANVVQERAKIVFAKYSAMTLLENRATLSIEVADEVKTLEELYHVNFTSVIVQDIDFSDAFDAYAGPKRHLDRW